MDPEEVLQAVTQKLREGVSPAEINAVLAESEDFPANNILELREIAAGESPRRQAALRRQAEGESPLAFATPFVSGLGGELVDEGLALADRLGIGEGDAAERFRGDVELASEQSPVATTASRVGGLLMSPATKLGAMGIRAASGLLGRGAAAAGQAAARGVGGGPLPQLAAKEAARGIGATTGGATAGAVEGGLFDLATREGSLEERAEEGPGLGTVLGAGGGAISSALGSGIGSVRRVNRLQREAGETAADAAERLGRNLPSRRTVNRRVEGANEARTAAFEQAEAAGQEIPGELTDLLASDSPIIRGALRNAASQGSPEATRFLNALEAVEAGERGSLPAASFKLVDDVRRQANFQGSTFKRQSSLLGADATPPSQTAVEEAQRLGGLIDETLERVPGFTEATEQSALAGTQARAFQAGQRATGEGSDVVEDLLSGNRVQIGDEAIRLPDSEQARQAFRAGVARPEILRLRGGAEQARNWLNTLDTSSELQNKMRVVLGGDEALEEFIAEANRLRAVGELEGVAELLTKSAGFFAFGSSLLGGAVSPFVIGP